jgi:hypothetical protein
MSADAGGNETAAGAPAPDPQPVDAPQDQEPQREPERAFSLFSWIRRPPSE